MTTFHLSARVRGGIQGDRRGGLGGLGRAAPVVGADGMVYSLEVPASSAMIPAPSSVGDADGNTGYFALLRGRCRMAHWCSITGRWAYRNDPGETNARLIPLSEARRRQPLPEGASLRGSRRHRSAPTARIRLRAALDRATAPSQPSIPAHDARRPPWPPQSGLSRTSGTCSTGVFALRLHRPVGGAARPLCGFTSPRAFDHARPRWRQRTIPGATPPWIYDALYAGTANCSGAAA